MTADDDPPQHPSLAAIFALTTWDARALAACSQAGLIEKFTDTLAWGLFPLYFVSRGLSPAAIGAVVAAYTGTWAVLQIYTGHLTDRVGRKWPIAVECGWRPVASCWWRSRRRSWGGSWERC